MSDDTIKIGKHSFSTLVAITPEEQAKGLMYKSWPPPIMCFPYSIASINKFWMKSTLSPLDILFCRNNKIISICYGEPMSTKLIGPNEPSDLVIELPYGTAKAHGINVGDDVCLNKSNQTIGRDIKRVITGIFK